MVKSDCTGLVSRSSNLILVQCDVCFLECEIKFSSYCRSGFKDGEWLCKSCKTKRTNLERWGVENPSQSEEVKERKKRTFIERWGVDHPSKSDVIAEKKVVSFMKKWRVENPFQSEEIKEIIKETNLSRWGVENPSQSDFIKSRKIKTLLEKWGVDHPLKSEDIKSKVIKSNLKKFGVEWSLQSPEIKERIKTTNLERWGVENPMLNNDILDSLKKSNLEKWGVEWFYQTEEFKSKSIISSVNKFGSSSFKKSDIFHQKTLIGSHKGYVKYLGESIHLFRCDLDHNFEIKTDNYFSRLYSNIPLCTICNPIGDLKSIKESDLYNFIKSIYDGEITQSYRDGLEIDIYLPHLKLGFEFNGLYWHSDKYKDKWYHLNKTKYFSELGIRIIHIWEDDWRDRREIIKSQINNLLNKNNRIFARKCDIVVLSTVSEFLNCNHIQGVDYSKVKLGLLFNGQLVSVMTFNKLEGRNSMGDGEWNLSRFCNKLNHNVIGGASKLLNYFVRNWGVKRVISYADRDWSLGGLYENLEFVRVSESRPDYKYLVGGVRVHKSKYKKSVTGISESKLDIPKIWDCGKLKFEKLF